MYLLGVTRSRRFVPLSLVVGLVALVTVVGLSAVPGTSLGAGGTAVKWPQKVSGHLITSYEGINPKTLVRGTEISDVEISHAHHGYPWASSFYGSTGFALAYLKGFQYPLISKNDGATWEIDSAYWSGPWADASAGAVFISAFSATEAVAYGNQWLYTTTDGGQHWYLTYALGNVEAAQPANVEWWVNPSLPRLGIIADVSRNGIYKDAGDVIGRAQYISLNGGQTWHLISLPK